MTKKQTLHERRIAVQVQSARLIDSPKGYEAIIKCSRWTDGGSADFFGYHFEKKGTYKIGDTIDNGGGIVSTVEAIV
jgi:hypothetical protein